MTSEARAALHAAEAAYWRDRAERLAEALRIASIDVADDYTRAISRNPEPPEPPVGTELWRGDQLIWRRLSNGWYCARVDRVCANCPAPWAEVWNIDGVREARRVLPGDDGDVVDAEVLPARCPMCEGEDPMTAAGCWDSWHVRGVVWA